MWELGKLKDWARPALDYAELITIARYARSAKQAKEQALEFVKRYDFDEEEGEKLAKACRWLHIIGRDYGSEAREELTREYDQKEESKMTNRKTDEFYVFTLHDGEIDLSIQGAVVARNSREAASVLGGEFIEVPGWPMSNVAGLDKSEHLKLCGKIKFARELFRRHTPQELARIPLDYDPGLYYERPGFFVLEKPGEYGREFVLRQHRVALPSYIQI